MSDADKMQRRVSKQGIRLTGADYDEIYRRIGRGETYAEAAVAVGCSEKTIQRLRKRSTVGHRPQKAPRAWSAHRLSVQEREEISRGLRGGLSLRRVAHQLGRSPSTISREVRVNGGTLAYRSWSANQSAQRRHRRPRDLKLANPKLRDAVERRLRDRWSPQQIATRLKADYPDDPSMHVSHETIYQSLFIQARGALRKELTACLRTGRCERRPRGRIERRGTMADMVMIRDRPPEADDRAIPGHWEGDLIIGKGNKSAIATLVERRSRFVLLAHLSNSRNADVVKEALAREIVKLPQTLRKTLTWDQGKEMARHAQLAVDTRLTVYFCDPHSPWQRGSNENTNGLLRQYFPKSTDLSVHSQADLDAVAHQLNNRPRQTLGWLKPAEVFNAVASTA